MASWSVAGIDAGTSAIKGVVVNEDGHDVRRIDCPIAQGTNPGEQFTADDMAAAIESVAETLWPFDALAIAGPVSSHLLVDEQGNALTATMTWGDHRARDFATDGWTATSVVARTRWWSAHEPEAFAAARWVMLPRDYAVLKLTGHVSTDRTSWPDLVQHGALSERVPDEVRALLPPVEDPAAVVSQYRGVPVVAGCMDALAAVLGVGPTPVGTGISVSGTSESAGVVAATETHRSTVRGTLHVPEGWWHAGPTQAGGRALTWAADLLERGDRTRFIQLVESAPRRPTGVLFLPYLDGERAPLWDPDAYASLIGMTGRDTPATIARAVFEGVAFAIRHVLDSAAPLDTPATRLVICGRLSAIDVWNQIKADVTGLETFVADESETGARGAAMLAATALTGLPLGDVRASLAPSYARVNPDAANVGSYESLYGSYVTLWPAMRDQMRRRLSPDDPQPRDGTGEQ
jgi:xylulokinase